ncbi:hypothetical protein NPX13_g9496 [Xylaria arbuscula]|uniref:Uncharacterized protein n=1 Tax=Xylaria arbuscula TaxID=114810 RepID=A0A9W8TIZ6_9PEZI|nr:hypothetical protein NPX13_g9496 [Xylaria arbuscula]
MCGALAHAAVKGLRSANVSHECIDVEVERLVALSTSQCPAYNGCNVAIPHVSTTRYAPVAIQDLAEAPVLPLQFLQPRKGAGSINTIESIGPVPIGQNA